MPNVNSKLLHRAIIGESGMQFSHRHRMPRNKALVVVLALQADLSGVSLLDMQDDLAGLRQKGAPAWLRNAWIAGAGLVVPPTVTVPSGWSAVQLYASFSTLAQMTPADIQDDLGLPWYSPSGLSTPSEFARAQPEHSELPLGRSPLLAWEHVYVELGIHGGKLAI